jgi:hypothetical protein
MARKMTAMKRMAEEMYHNCDECNCEDNPNWDFVDEVVVDHQGGRSH